ncbi:MAG: TetR/AcrR family transcriptional regulator [Chloroflexi bacterium]|nr:MAG: TetR/AcrR family transcriptional regulator [Chloroflexota bacterium]
MSRSIPLEIIDDQEDGRSQRRDAIANRKLILRTAEKLFAERGVHEVNMADIAQAAGVGKGTLYRRFTNKAALCLALMDAQMREFQNTMLERMRTMSANGVSRLEQLMHFLDALVHFTDAHVPLLCEIQREGMVTQDETSLQLPHFWQYMTVNGLLRAAREAGEIAPDLDVDYLADALLAPLKADIFRYQREVRGFSLERISQGLQTLVSGLRVCV